MRDKPPFPWPGSQAVSFKHPELPLQVFAAPSPAKGHHYVMIANIAEGGCRCVASPRLLATWKIWKHLYGIDRDWLKAPDFDFAPYGDHPRNTPIPHIADFAESITGNDDFFRGTNKGTVATLTGTTVFDVLGPSDNGQDNEPTTNEQRTNNERTTNEQRTNNERTTNEQRTNNERTTNEQRTNNEPVTNQQRLTRKKERKTVRILLPILTNRQ